MTATQTVPETFLHTLMSALRWIRNWAAKAFLALAIIFMAGVIAIATAAAGLTLAAVALIMRLSGSRPDQTHFEEDTSGEAITLQARKTPRGWTVE